MSGFHYKLDASELANPGKLISVTPVAHDVNGAQHTLPDAHIELDGLELSFADTGRAAQLRERAVRAADSRERGRATRRVLAFIHDLELGGSQLYFIELLERVIGANQWSCTLVSPSDGPLRHRAEALGIAVHVRDGLGLGSIEGYEGRMHELIAWADIDGVDIVFANSLISFVGVDLAQRIGAPSLFFIHESSEFPAWSPSTHTWFSLPRYVRERIEAAIGQADFVLFEADATRRQYEHLGCPERLLALPYAVELRAIEAYRADFDPEQARARLEIPPSATVIACIGTVEPRKGQVPLAQAFSLIADAHPDAFLCVVGDGGNAYSKGLRRYIKRSGLRSRVLTSPMVSDPYQWHGVADLLVIPSDRESLPRVALEAMAFETPVLATRVSGLPALLQTGEAGYLCAPRDVSALASALDTALTCDPDAREAMVRRAAKVVRTHHLPERYAAAIERMTTELIEGASGDPEPALAWARRLSRASGYDGPRYASPPAAPYACTRSSRPEAAPTTRSTRWAW